jgi:hypothetical protein
MLFWLTDCSATLWNDFTTIASYRLISISQNQITDTNLERKGWTYHVGKVFIKYGSGFGESKNERIGLQVIHTG